MSNNFESGVSMYATPNLPPEYNKSVFPPYTPNIGIQLTLSDIKDIVMQVLREEGLIK